MIPMTAAEIKVLIEARDLLTEKLAEADPDTELWLSKALNGVLGVLKHSFVDVS